MKNLIKKIKTLHSFSAGKEFSYGDPAEKKKIHSLAKPILRELAKTLEIENPEIRTNYGGIAVLGESTLYSENIAIQINRCFAIPSELMFFFRSTKGRKDYTGGKNQYITLKEFLKDPESSISLFSRAKNSFI